MTTKSMLQIISAATLCGTLLIAGCKISHRENGEDTKVSIEAPGASVKVDTGSTANDSGMPLYPGAQGKSNSGDDKNRARVNLNTPFLKLKVVALKFTSDDPPEKILAFYRTKLGNFGTVLECKGDDPNIATGHSLNSPVSCGEKHGDSGEISLKVGTENNQHLVSVKPSGKGSEFALVYIHLGKDKGDDDYGGKQPS